MTIDDPATWSEAELAVLRARTAALARPAGSGLRAGEPAVFVSVGRQRFCVLARQVRAAIRLQGLARVPQAPRAVAGAIVREGTVIPVFHFAVALGERLERLPEMAHALVVGRESDELALTVDAVDRVAELPEDALGPVPEAAVASGIVRGTAPGGELVIDLDALLASERLWVDVKPTTRSD